MKSEKLAVVEWRLVGVAGGYFQGRGEGTNKIKVMPSSARDQASGCAVV